MNEIFEQIKQKVNDQQNQPSLEKLLELDDHLQLMVQKKKENDKKLAQLESQIYAFEGRYLENGISSTGGGDLARGYEGFLSGPRDNRQSAVGLYNNQSTLITDEDRIFSKSSASSDKSLQMVKDQEETQKKKKKVAVNR